jgi:L-fuculose-phosphate aldolase
MSDELGPAAMQPLAEELIVTAIAMGERGINNGTAGNVSARVDDGILITPSSVPYDALDPSDIIHMAFDTTWSPLRRSVDSRRPSSEWRFHLDIMKARPDVSAVVHAHPISATALAVHGRGIEAFHYMVAVAGGTDIRCAPYATFGTPELSANALAALADRRACLLAHHGLIAVGADLASALDLAVEVEVLAAQYLAASVLGPPPLLSEQQMAEVLAKFASPDGYGSAPPAA